MIAQTARDPWRVAWQIATSDYVIAILLLGIAAGLVITAWLPQMPVADPVAYARWLSETQGRFGNATAAIQASVEVKVVGVDRQEAYLSRARSGTLVPHHRDLQLDGVETFLVTDGNGRTRVSGHVSQLCSFQHGDVLTGE